MASPFNMIDGRLEQDLSRLAEPSILHPSATPPRLKVHAARYFLTRAEQFIRNEAAALYYLEAFLQALRASTWALQNVAAHAPGFQAWYQQKQREMHADPLLRIMKRLRNVSEKRGGIRLVEFETRSLVKQSRDGETHVEAGAPRLRIAGADFDDPVAEFWRATDLVTSVIEEAHEAGFVVPVQTKRRAMLEFLREREDGTWEHFDP